MQRKSINTTLDRSLYEEIQRLALTQSVVKDKRVYANELIEEGMELVLEKYRGANQLAIPKEPTPSP